MKLPWDEEHWEVSVEKHHGLSIYGIDMQHLNNLKSCLASIIHVILSCPSSYAQTSVFHIIPNVLQLLFFGNYIYLQIKATNDRMSIDIKYHL